MVEIVLRPYQSDRFINPLRAAFGRGRKSVLGVLPTGGGKTICFCAMAKAAVERGRRVGIVAHRIEILDQISAALERFHVPHGFIAPGRWSDPLARVQVCSVQSLAKRIERVHENPFDLLILDEAHHCAAGSSWHQIAGVHSRQGKHVLGVTATPRRLSGEPLSDAFEEMVIGPSVAELIELKALSPYRAFAPATVDMTGVTRRGGDFARDQNEARMDKPTITGDMVREYRRRCMGKRALVFCVSVAHAEHVAAQFAMNGIPAASVDGRMDRTQRRSIMKAFETGEVPVLTSADLVSEGYDVPAIEAVLLGRPTESLTLYRQQVGRAFRPAPGKDFALILDHAGNIARHGLPDDDIEWSLEGAAKGAGKPGGSTMPTRICAACFGVFRPALACPYCGTAVVTEGRSVKEVEGDLAELDLEATRRARKAEAERSQREARDLPSLARVAVQQGRKAGWVVHLMKARGDKVPAYHDVIEAMRKAGA